MEFFSSRDCKCKDERKQKYVLVGTGPNAILIDSFQVSKHERKLGNENEVTNN